MGAAASSSHPPLVEEATSNRPTPSPEASASSAKEDPDPQHSTAAAGGVADDAAASADAGSGGAGDAAETVVLDASAEAGGAGEAEEEKGECGFCLYMKGGGCEEEFTAWEKCVEEGEAAGGSVDVVERCQDATLALRKCMDAHADYYEPVLRAERAMAADLEAFKAQEAASESAVPSEEEGQRKQAAAEASSEEGQKRQVAEAAVSERESKDRAA